MPGKTVYLEAPDRTQDLLNIKWTLRSAGYAIGSTWHEGEITSSSFALKDHWSARGVEQLQMCDSLVVLGGESDRSMPELAMMAGFALARGLGVLWIGSAVRGLSDFRTVQQFNTAEDFQIQIIKHMYSRSMSLNADRLVA